MNTNRSRIYDLFIEVFNLIECHKPVIKWNIWCRKYTKLVYGRMVFMTVRTSWLT